MAHGVQLDMPHVGLLQQPDDRTVATAPVLDAAQGPPYSNRGFNSLTGISSISNISSSSIGLPMSSAQPSKVWIGRTGADAEEGYGPVLGSEVIGPAGEHEEEGLAVGAGLSSQRATSRQQTVRRRGSGAVNLPSLVTA
jgi:hypothetical protein